MGRIEKLKAWAGRLKTELDALHLAYRDPRVPAHARVFAVIVLAYALSPIDLIPDPIPVLGYLDDLILVPLGVALAVRMIPSEVLAECRAKARDAETEVGLKGVVAAAVVAAIWLLLAAFAVYLASGALGYR